MLKIIAMCSSVFGFAIAFQGSEAFAQPTTPPALVNPTQGNTATPSMTLPTWLSQAGEHWIKYYGSSYIDTSSIRMGLDKETGKNIIEYWRLTDNFNDELAVHFPRDKHIIALQRMYLDCESDSMAIASEADRTIDGVPATFRPDHESDRTFENREYVSIAPGDPDEIIARNMCRLATPALQQPSSPQMPAWRTLLRQLGRAMQQASTQQPVYSASGGGQGQPAYSSSAPAAGQPVYSPSECVGPIVAGVCKGTILPNQATHPVCHGEMLNGTCTGPMF